MNLCVVCPAGHSVILHSTKFDAEVACPRCLAVFPVERPRVDTERASKDSGKRPTKKKKDDDDEEDEKPRKKKPAKDAKDEKKKPPPKKKKSDEDDDDDDDEKEEVDPEDDITWTSKKRGLNTCLRGLGIIAFGYYGLIGLYLVTVIGVSMAAFGPTGGMYATGIMALKYGALPTALIVLGTFLFGLFLNIRIPAKAEAGVGLYSAIAMGLFTIFVTIIMVIANSGTFFEDENRTANFVNLLFGIMVICYIAAWMAMMGYNCSVLSFMGMTMEASQPITNGVFGCIPFVAILALHFMGGTLRTGIGEFMGWVIIAAGVGLMGYATYMLFLQIVLTNMLRAAIWDHIVWE